MQFTNGTVRTLGIGFDNSFQRGVGQAASMRDLVATTINSSTGQNEYGWLGKFPRMREWLGDRVINQMQASKYVIANKDWEGTVEVDRNDIEDDNIGIYAPLFEELGRGTQSHPDELVFALLLAGFATNCYDGQYFFDTDHPVLDANGAPISVANTDGGAGTPWFLIDDSRALKPIIFQLRKAAKLVAKDREDDENVFHKRKLLYGVDGRYNVGYGFWQFAWGSKQTLDAAHYATARAALGGMKGDHGRPLGIMPKTLLVPPSLESAALKIVNNELGANGETNEWKGTATVKVIPWLA